jgi:hypothetical protein
MRIVRSSMITAIAIALASLVSFPSSAAASVGVASPEVTVDFSSFGEGPFDPNFYHLDGIVFPSQRCGSVGCTAWLVSLVQGDDALLGDPSFGSVTARFTRPVSDLSLSFAPDLQGTATYVLRAYGGSGEVIASTSITVTEDFGDPANEGFGYHVVSLANLSTPVVAFTLDSIFVRSSFPSNVQIGYGVSSISYTHWGTQP